jgi:acetone carboxylase gamma subunit
MNIKTNDAEILFILNSIKETFYKEKERRVKMEKHLGDLKCMIPLPPNRAGIPLYLSELLPDARKEGLNLTKKTIENILDSLEGWGALKRSKYLEEEESIGGHIYKLEGDRRHFLVSLGEAFDSVLKGLSKDKKELITYKDLVIDKQDNKIWDKNMPEKKATLLFIYKNPNRKVEKPECGTLLLELIENEGVPIPLKKAETYGNLKKVILKTGITEEAWNSWIEIANNQIKLR